MRRCLITLGVLTILSGCGYESLYSDLGEQQVNEMLALLLREDIDARKSRVDKGWSLEITVADLPRAMQKLQANGYPRDNYESLGDVFKKEGFVSSPLEERARLLHGLSQELSETVSNIDGVVVARVHLAIPENNALSDKRSLSSASVFIKHRPDSQVTKQTAAIKALVVNGVEGLPYDHVTVAFFATDTAPVYPQADNRASWKFALPDTLDWSDKRLLGAAGAGAFVSLAALLWVLRALLRRRRISQLTRSVA